jgi:hypothetical protein
LKVAAAAGSASPPAANAGSAAAGHQAWRVRCVAREVRGACGAWRVWCVVRGAWRVARCRAWRGVAWCGAVWHGTVGVNQHACIAAEGGGALARSARSGGARVVSWDILGGAAVPVSQYRRAPESVTANRVVAVAVTSTTRCFEVPYVVRSDVSAGVPQCTMCGARDDSARTKERTVQITFGAAVLSVHRNTSPASVAAVTVGMQGGGWSARQQPCSRQRHSSRTIARPQGERDDGRVPVVRQRLDLPRLGVGSGGTRKCFNIAGVKSYTDGRPFTRSPYLALPHMYTLSFTAGATGFVNAAAALPPPLPPPKPHRHCGRSAFSLKSTAPRAIGVTDVTARRNIQSQTRQPTVELASTHTHTHKPTASSRARTAV